MIERWFPCAEVSAASASGWGSGKSEKALFTWFAARPLAQAKAAVLTSLLPWPEDEPDQRRLKDLVRKAMTGRDAAHAELVAELAKTYPEGASVLDPFSGRAMIPLEAARLGVTAHGVDYAPVATLAGQLLANFPLRDWAEEPNLPFGKRDTLDTRSSRLVDDVRLLLDEVGARYADRMAEVYPMVAGKQPWGYLWAVTLPCQECGHRFPLTGSLVLRHPLPATHDVGQSYRIDADRRSGEFHAVVHDGPPTGRPTLVAAVKDGKAVRGKAAICPFCEHVHLKATHTRLMVEGHGRDALLVAADLDVIVGKRFRQPADQERIAVETAEQLLRDEADFAPGLPAVPNEPIPAGNNDTVRPSAYGARTYGDLCNPRQTLGFVRLARVISDLGKELSTVHGLSESYAAALTGYAASVLVRRLRRSTRGTTLQPHLHATSNRVQTHDIFVSESAIAFAYDYFETALGDGPATWPSLADDTVAVLRNQAGRPAGRPADISRGSAVALPMRDRSLSAVITDPPYDNMIDYTDASDLFFVWLRRALITTAPTFAFTSHPDGVQEKEQEAIVKRGGTATNDHRTATHYDEMIARSFAEARRVVVDEGVVTIVFGHGDPDVWHRLLGAITRAGLVLTGSWPAKTEAGGSAGSANIVTTLTMSCRPAPTNRPIGRANLVDSEVRQQVKARIQMWDAAGLAPTDQLMASAGPAMEAVGRYQQVLNHLGDPVDPAHYLVVARRAVEEAAAVVIDHLPLETFDVRTRFALSWARLYRRSVAPKSEARWQALAADLSSDELKGVLEEADKGVRLGYAKDWKGTPTETSATIDVAMAMAKAWPDGLDAVADVLVATGRDTADNYLWATIGYLSSLLPEADPDAVAWTSLVRGRGGIGAVTRGVASARRKADDLQDAKNRQGSLFDTRWQEGVSQTQGESARGDAGAVMAEESQ
jgi:putative DNA methylase